MSGGGNPVVPGAYRPVAQAPLPSHAEGCAEAKEVPKPLGPTITISPVTNGFIVEENMRPHLYTEPAKQRVFESVEALAGYLCDIYEHTDS